MVEDRRTLHHTTTILTRVFPYDACSDEKHSRIPSGYSTPYLRCLNNKRRAALQTDLIMRVCASMWCIHLLKDCGARPIYNPAYAALTCKAIRESVTESRFINAGSRDRYCSSVFVQILVISILSRAARGKHHFLLYDCFVKSYRWTLQNLIMNLWTVCATKGVKDESSRPGIAIRRLNHFNRA